MLETLLQNNGYVLTVVALLSLLIGSFLNVVIWRMPRQLKYTWQQECKTLLESQSGDSEPPPGVVWPASHCPSCKTTIKPWDNIPVVSYLLLGGKCRQCKSRIGLRYPVYELLTAILSVIVVWQFGVEPYTAVLLLATWMLVAMTGIDIDHQLLPDQLTLSLLWLGLIISTQSFAMIGPADAIIGAAAGYLLLWSFYHLFRILTGKHGMGYGDFKLLAALGAFTGWQLLPAIILISSVSGAVIGIIWLAVNRKNSQTPIPFGPFLAVGGWIAMNWRDEILALYS